MKPSWKEILVIFALAVLATALSWFVIAKEFHFGFCVGIDDCQSGPFLWRGWPLPYVTELGLNFYLLVFDLLFYSVSLLIGWLAIKFTHHKINKRS